MSSALVALDALIVLNETMLTVSEISGIVERMRNGETISELELDEKYILNKRNIAAQLERIHTP